MNIEVWMFKANLHVNGCTDLDEIWCWGQLYSALRRKIFFITKKWEESEMSNGELLDQNHTRAFYTYNVTNLSAELSAGAIIEFIDQNWESAIENI